ncbi:hypothetical protein T01_11071 [Trichinella spiralis]|uniref:Uncharacterized protein n=1 Tax=Trichinella spiralis TaxID=6334 RepID=A0A0V1ANF2_TRISP|nr:hypothetical protein T01_11071 [Trichinella spiralis]
MIFKSCYLIVELLIRFMLHRFSILCSAICLIIWNFSKNLGDIVIMGTSENLGDFSTSGTF